MCAFTYREESFRSSCVTGAHFKIYFTNDPLQREEVEFTEPPSRAAAWFVRKVPGWFIEIMQLLRSGWFEWEWRWEVLFRCPATLNDCLWLSRHREMRSRLFVVVFSPLRSPAWTRKRAAVASGISRSVIRTEGARQSQGVQFDFWINVSTYSLSFWWKRITPSKQSIKTENMKTCFSSLFNEFCMKNNNPSMSLQYRGKCGIVVFSTPIPREVVVCFFISVSTKRFRRTMQKRCGC